MPCSSFVAFAFAGPMWRNAEGSMFCVVMNVKCDLMLMCCSMDRDPNSRCKKTKSKQGVAVCCCALQKAGKEEL